MPWDRLCFGPQQTNQCEPSGEISLRYHCHHYLYQLHWYGADVFCWNGYFIGHQFSQKSVKEIYIGQIWIMIRRRLKVSSFLQVIGCLVNKVASSSIVKVDAYSCYIIIDTGKTFKQSHICEQWYKFFLPHGRRIPYICHFFYTDKIFGE